jgi:hypothetical protein
MYAAWNNFLCPDHAFSAISPPFFVFPRAATRNIGFLPRTVSSVRNLPQIGLQEIADEKLEAFVIGLDSRSC